MAVHISNRYLDLKPVLREVVAKLGKHGWLSTTTTTKTITGTHGSTWVLVTDSRKLFAQAPLDGVREPLASERRVRLWTDDYSDLWGVLK